MGSGGTSKAKFTIKLPNKPRVTKKRRRRTIMLGKCHAPSLCVLVTAGKYLKFEHWLI